jgi:type IV secretory pathway TrbL component
MATNLIKQLYGRARNIGRRLYAIHTVRQRTIQAATNHQQQQQQAAVKQRKQVIRSKVKGVQRTTRSVTTGNRKQRANQLRQLRANPATKQQLRRRAQFYTV